MHFFRRGLGFVVWVPGFDIWRLGFEVLELGFDAFFHERVGLRGFGARLRYLGTGLRGVWVTPQLLPGRLPLKPGKSNNKIFDRGLLPYGG